MNLRTTVLLGTWILLALNLLLGFGAIGLLARMTPAIERIIAQNDDSLAACEDMLATLAAPDATGAADRFAAAFDRARTNVTEPEETDVLARIGAQSADGLPRGADARLRLVEEVQALAAINRGAMEDADARTQRLGVAGAWGVVFLAALAFASGLLYQSRLNRNVLAPIEEMQVTLAARAAGDAHRRCASATAGRDLRRVMDAVNGYLDLR